VICPVLEGDVVDLRIRRLFFKTKVLTGDNAIQVIDVCWRAFNRAVFGLQMRKPTFRLLTHTGWFGVYHYPSNPTEEPIYLGLRAVHALSSYENFRDLMLHEMCHQYQREVLNDKGPSHSEVWIDLARTLQLFIPEEDI
jgi:hypothetical protein